MRKKISIVLLIICTILSLDIITINSADKQMIVNRIHSENDNNELLFIIFPEPGWYLVSLPVKVTDNTLHALFPSALSAYSWETDRYIDTDTLGMYKGYWLEINETSMTIITGIPLTVFRRHYTQGWYLIGSVIDTVDFTDANDSPDDSILSPLYYWYGPEQIYRATNTLTQCYGHWMAVYDECDLIIQSNTEIEVRPGPISRNYRSVLRQQYQTHPPPPPFEINQKKQILTQVISEVSYNFPNPFNASTLIQFRLLQDGYTQIKIYNISGQCIRTFAKDYLQNGQHQVIWDGSDDRGEAVSSGVYIYKIDSPSFSLVGKMAVMR